MKIAICFSGSIRDFMSCYPSIKRYMLDNLQPDIFLHLWKMDSIGSLSSEVRFKWRNDSCNENYVVQMLKPKSYVIDSYSEQWEKNIIEQSGINIDSINVNDKNYAINACGMYYKIMKCFHLVEDYSKQNNVNYDLVIRARLDFIWEDHIKLSDFNSITDNTIFLIKDRYATKSKLLTNDKYFAGNMITMKKMCDLFNQIKTYQSYGLKIEGQTLNENHIRFSRFNVTWIGHMYTYYKCMGRHAIKPKKLYILINNSYDKLPFWFELSYRLMYNNYYVIYKNRCQNYDLSVLESFPNFNYFDQLKNLSPYITISDNNNAFNIIKGNNVISITINQNIKILDFVDTIYSIILKNNSSNTYSFIDNEIVTQINTGDSVIYKYLDHGYYQCILLGKINNDKYNLFLNKKKISVKRNEFKIIDILCYYDPLKQIMPTNINPDSDPVLSK